MTTDFSAYCTDIYKKISAQVAANLLGYTPNDMVSLENINDAARSHILASLKHHDGGYADLALFEVEVLYPYSDYSQCERVDKVLEKCANHFGTEGGDSGYGADYHGVWIQFISADAILKFIDFAKPKLPTGTLFRVILLALPGGVDLAESNLPARLTDLKAVAAPKPPLKPFPKHS